MFVKKSYLLLTVLFFTIFLLNFTESRVKRMKIKKDNLPQKDGVQAQQPQTDYEDYDTDYTYYDELEENKSK